MGRPFGQPVTVVLVTAGTAGTNGVVAVAAIAGIAGVVVKKPQPLAQTCQSTPAFVESFATAAIRFTVAAASSCEGAYGTNRTESAVAGTIVTGVDVTLTVLSAVDVATMATWPAASAVVVPAGGTGGAVYVTFVALAD
jgi:hypothetical protein